MYVIRSWYILIYPKNKSCGVPLKVVCAKMQPYSQQSKLVNSFSLQLGRYYMSRTNSIIMPCNYVGYASCNQPIVALEQLVLIPKRQHTMAIRRSWLIWAVGSMTCNNATINDVRRETILFSDVISIPLPLCLLYCLWIQCGKNSTLS